ncbi:MAG: hypothetical protein JHD16_01845 [Solirubrobacteraceae bacterium]|nr:hypothetical protein [Solirubrobacteraceae bacterium]
MVDTEQSHPPLRAEDLPAQPPSVDEAQTLSELLRGDDLGRFAMTFDGYAHFGERWGEVLAARREEWEEARTLPRDASALRALLFLTFRQERFLELDDAVTVRDADGNVTHAAAPELITDARREHERFKHALLAKLRELAG